MLGVACASFVHWTALAMLSERRKLYEHRPPEGAKPARGGSGMASGRPLGGSFLPVGTDLAAKAAQKPWLGGPGGALGTLVTLLEASWGPPGASRAAPLRLLGVILGPPKG